VTVIVPKTDLIKYLSPDNPEVEGGRKRKKKKRKRVEGGTHFKNR